LKIGPGSIVQPFILVVMGVSGAGKSTLATALAEALKVPFQEGDALHPPANVAKMAAGEPLSDEDRAPWLARIREWIDTQLAQGRSGIIACSALKRAYRDRLRADRTNVVVVYIDGDADLIRQRLSARRGHFMPARLLASQFATLEPPTADEHAVVVSAAAPTQVQVRQVIESLTHRPR
jgi:carbohydrate kinase (thermoresistant glucokinase family)